MKTLPTGGESSKVRRSSDLKQNAIRQPVVSTSSGDVLLRIATLSTFSDSSVKRSIRRQGQDAGAEDQVQPASTSGIRASI